MLEVSRLSKSFPGEKGSRATALKDVSFSLAGGEVLCLLGPNGSGKTTLMKILAGLVAAEEGRAAVAGFELPGNRSEVQALVGFSPGEERSFYGRLSCLENLRFFARLRGIAEAGLKDRLAELEETLELSGLLALDYQKASSGMKQRVALARALLHRPRALLLDEPTKSLDPAGAERLRDFVAREFKGKKDRVVLWSTHRVEEAWETGTQIVVIQGGSVLAQASPEELLRRAKTAAPKEAYLALTKVQAPC